jgi:hypothetical protein
MRGGSSVQTLKKRTRTQAEERRAKLAGIGALAAGGIVMLTVGLVACESATNLDVRYGDASAAIEASSGDAGAGEGGATGTGTPVFAGCPCDEQQGQGCCLPSAGGPFCTTDETFCASATGTHLKCVRPDINSESVCCWRGSGATARTALAAVCDGGPAACVTDGDCAGTGETCAIARCFGGTITIGACGKAPPTCPQP